MSKFDSRSGTDTGSDERQSINKIAIYLRSYGTEDSYTATLERELREFVDRRNQYKPWGEVVEVFRDCGMGYGAFPLPGQKALLRAVKSRKVTLVLVPQLRDLAILPRDLFRVFRVLDRHRCGLRSQHEYLLFEDLREK